MDAHDSWIFGERGAVDGHCDGWVVVFQADELVVPEFAGWDVNYMSQTW